MMFMRGLLSKDNLMLVKLLLIYLHLLNKLMLIRIHYKGKFLDFNKSTIRKLMI